MFGNAHTDLNENDRVRGTMVAKTISGFGAAAGRDVLARRAAFMLRGVSSCSAFKDLKLGFIRYDRFLCDPELPESVFGVPIGTFRHEASGSFQSLVLSWSFLPDVRSAEDAEEALSIGSDNPGNLGMTLDVSFRRGAASCGWSDTASTASPERFGEVFKMPEEAVREIEDSPGPAGARVFRNWRKGRLYAEMLSEARHSDSLLVENR